MPSDSLQEGEECCVTESAAYFEAVALSRRVPSLAGTTAVRHGTPADTILVATNGASPSAPHHRGLRANAEIVRHCHE